MNKSAQAFRFTMGFVIFSLFLCIVALIVLFFANSYTANEYEDTLSPTPQNMRCVVIDAGHGGEDGGAIGVSGVLEKDINLSVSKMLYDLLKANGIPAIMTRDEDKMLYDKYPDHNSRKKTYDLRARVDIASETEGAILVSIHMNSFPDTSCRGAQVYYSKNHTESLVVAGKIQTYIAAHVQRENSRKIKGATSAIYLLERVECPAVLVECGFLSNANECALLSDTEYQKKLAVSIFAAICDYLLT